MIYSPNLELEGTMKSGALLVVLGLVAVCCRPQYSREEPEVCVVNAPSLMDYEREPIPEACPEIVESKPWFDGQPCGTIDHLSQQARWHEVPVEVRLETKPELPIDRITAFYAYNCSDNWVDAQLVKTARGFGANLSCELPRFEDMHPYGDSQVVRYYVLGYDDQGKVICGHGSPENPQPVKMVDCAEPSAGIDGLPAPKNCRPCKPWDQICDGWCWLPCEEAEKHFEGFDRQPFSGMTRPRCSTSYCGRSVLR